MVWWTLGCVIDLLQRCGCVARDMLVLYFRYMKDSSILKILCDEEYIAILCKCKKQNESENLLVFRRRGELHEWNLSSKVLYKKCQPALSPKIKKNYILPRIHILYSTPCVCMAECLETGPTLPLLFYLILIRCAV